MHPALEQTDHRPWPLPQGSWLLRQSWLKLAFIHWEIDPEFLRKLLPPPLELDLFVEKAWIAVVPFDMKGVTFRGVPAISRLSDFPEINVRTYVRYKGKPGVWFFSLDVPSRLAVWAARTFFHLPYRQADVEISKHGEAIHYRHRLAGESFAAEYRPVSPAPAEPGSFDFWATERYCLYCTNHRGDLFRTEVQHRKWPLEQASIHIRENHLLDAYPTGPRHPSVLFCRRLEVVAYPPKKIWRNPDG